MLVAEKEKKEIIGFLIAYKHRDKAYLNTIAISEEHRGKGVGGLLLQTIENELRNRRVELLTLSVKADNTKALDFYLRKDYTFARLVFILEAPIDAFECESNEASYTVKKISPAKIRYRALRMSTWWSLLIEPVDKLIYKKRFYRKEEAMVVLKKKRIKGFIEFYTDSVIEVEGLGMSSYQEDVLKTIMCELKKIGMERGARRIRVYVDSSKAFILKALENLGFRIVDAEYLLKKELKPPP